MFNPANFSLNPVAQARMDRAAAPVDTAGEHAYVRELEKAAARFALRRDNFASGKDLTCLDIAAKLDRFGSFASEAQKSFAHKLIGWSLPRGAQHPLEAAPVVAPVAVLPVQAVVAAPAPVERKATTLPKLFELMQRLSKLTIGSITIARKNQDSLCWIKLEGVEKVVGRITDGGVVTLFARQDATGRMVDQPDLLSRLASIETDPEAAAVRHGKASGRCSICSRDLTDPVSIERGIGPICIGKAGW